MTADRSTAPAPTLRSLASQEAAEHAVLAAADAIRAQRSMRSLAASLTAPTLAVRRAVYLAAAGALATAIEEKMLLAVTAWEGSARHCTECAKEGRTTFLTYKQREVCDAHLMASSEEMGR